MSEKSGKAQCTAKAETMFFGLRRLLTKRSFTPFSKGGAARRVSVYPLHIHISFLYILLIVALLSIIGIFNYNEAKKNVLLATRQIFIQLNNEIKSRVQHLQDISTESIAYLYQSPVVASQVFSDKMKLTPLMGTVLQFHPELSSIALGYADGSFFRFGRVAGGAQESNPALQEAHYLIRSYEGRGATQDLIYLNHHFDVVSQVEAPFDGYDPRNRHWYRQAIASDRAISTKPYFLLASESLGKSVAQKSPDGGMVISIAFPLTGVDKIFDSLKPTDSSKLLVLDSDDKVFYYSELDIAIKKTPEGGDSLYTLQELDYPLYTIMHDAIDSEEFDTPLIVNKNGNDLFFAVTQLMGDAVGGMEYYVAISSPASDMFPDAAGLVQRQGMFTLMALFLAVPVSWLFSRRLSKDLVELSEVAQDARNFSFSLKEPVRSSVVEFNELSMSIFHTNRTLKRFLDINTAISLERNYAHLLRTVVSETMGAVDAATGILYLLSGDATRLLPSAAICAGPADDSTARDTDFLSSLSPVEKMKEGQGRYLSATCKGAPQVRRLAREDWPSEDMRKAFSASHMQLIAVPLVYNRKVTGIVCLYRHDEKGEPNRYVIAFISQLSGGAAVAIENHRLIGDQKRLFDAFIQLVAESIDAKSHYTGGHCQRVPVIAKLLALAVDAADEGPFADFHISEEGWEALRIASWLHDCGKIITPEHVVDKATKLETVYDRIHEIRMRFEVLKRDAELACCRAILRGADEKSSRDALSAELKRIDDDFAFLATCNIGNEAMTPEHGRRLRTIANYTWQRTLSDRLGISEAEKNRKAAYPEPALPATEPLLADKPEHLIQMDESVPHASGGGIGRAFSSPVYKYNLGEITNLCIGRGTLTEEERFQVNCHVVQTIRMLSHLPFPKEYDAIVEIAGSHHERVDATGYPRGIGKEDMLVEARIVAIADVFEALTAADRPYKKAKKLSEALGIMSHMAKNGHLDADLFAIFIRSGVYRQYAAMCLESAQTDAVDEERLLL